METDLQRRVREALEERKAEQAERQERFESLNAAGEKRIAEKEKQKAAELASKQAENQARREQRQEQAYATMKRQYRARFNGPDAAFEAVWPDVLARITAAQSVRHVTRL